MHAPPVLKLLILTPLALGLWALIAAALWFLKLYIRAFGRPAHDRTALMVSWEFPPCAATGVHLPTSFVRHAADAGWRMQVVCGPAPSHVSAAGRELASMLPAGAAIAHVSRLLADDRQMRLYPAWTVPGIDGGYLAALAMTLTAALAFCRTPPAAIVASGPRFANFAAARRLADLFGAQLLLQYRDEWTVNTPDFVTVTDKDRPEELACLGRADVVSFVSDGKCAAYRAAFPEIDPAKFIVTPNGWEPYVHARAQDGTHHLPVPAGTFSLTYTGRYHRSFAPLLASYGALLARRPDLARVRLIFVGEQLPHNRALMEAFARRYPDVLIDLPAAPATTAIEMQRESTALLLVNDHSYDGVVPLKTFDYLCSARPILVVGRTGGAAEIVETLEAGMAVPIGDDAALEAALNRLMTGNRPWDTAARKAWCARHSRPTLVAEMLAALTARAQPAV